MKMKKEHRVPLSEPVLAILQKMQSLRHNDYIFANAKKGLSSMAMLQVLKRMGQTDITVHGFRSTFRNWAAECSDYPNEVVEMALAHTIKNAAEAAYRRGDLLEKRRNLMEDWAQFCEIEKSITTTS
jgi:integrase